MAPGGSGFLQGGWKVMKQSLPVFFTASAWRLFAERLLIASTAVWWLLMADWVPVFASVWWLGWSGPWWLNCSVEAMPMLHMVPKCSCYRHW